MKRAISLFLTVIMLLSIVPFSAFATKSAKSTYSEGDIIEFGSYPQMEVTNNYVLNSLNNLSLNWKSYGYYSSDGDGDFIKGDWMKYADVTYNGNKYRAVKFTKYRPTCTDAEALDYGYEDGNWYTNQDENGYYADEVYWFLYEPLEWVVLETLISYKDESQTIIANYYSQSDIRTWLNNDFYNTAFSSSEKNYINTTELYTINPYNKDNNYYYTSQDKVFLLSTSEECSTHYGFSEYASCDARNKEGSDYTKIQGVSLYTDDNNCELVYSYLTRSAGIRACFVQTCDYIKGTYSKASVNSNYGICPAIHLNKITGRCETNQLGNKTFGEFIVNNKVVNANNKLVPTIDINWFDDSSATYNHEIAKLCSIAALEGYQYKGDYYSADLKSFLMSLGFSIASYKKETNYYGYKSYIGVDYLELDTKRDEVNYFIAYKKIKKGYTLVFMGLIGSNKLQWNSNFDPEGTKSTTNRKKWNQKNHYGFNDAKNFAYDKLSKFMKENELNSTNSKILLTGHSRGAAAANLLAADLINETKNKLVKKENLFTYTFATPNNTKDKKVKNDDYKGIFNIVFPTDFVTHVLLEKWGYGKYGKTYKLPTGSNDKNYKAYKKRMLNYYTAINPVTKKDGKVDKDKLKEFNDYRNGTEFNVNAIVSIMGAYVDDLNEYYNKKYTVVGSPGPPPFNLIPIIRMSPFEFFQHGLCPQVNKTKNQDEKDTSLRLMLAPIADDFVSQGGSNLFKSISGFFIVNQRLDARFEDAHKMETYCSFMLALSSDEVTQKRGAKKVSCNCPVDVEIVDKSDSQTVAKITNNKVDQSVADKENALYAEVNGDEKTVWLPSNGNYDIKITGNDNGKLDYSIENTDAEEGEVQRVNYFDLDVVKGEQYTSALNNDNYSLKDKSGNSLSANEVLTENVQYNINVSVSGRGAATDSLSVTSGDYVTLNATEKCSDFAGWYENGTLISEEPEYRFRPTRDMNIVAEFENERTHTYKNTVKKATQSANGTLTKICSVCGEGNVSIIHKIKSVSLSTVKYTYGSVRTPGVTVKDSAGKTLKKNTDYTVTYPGGRKNVGSYTVKVVFKGKYSGTKKLTFKIYPKGTSLSKLSPAKKAFTAKWKRQLTQNTGYQLQYSRKASFSGAKTITIKNYKAYKYTAKKLAAKKVYYVRIRTYKKAAGVNYFSGWSKAKKVKTKK